MESNDPDVVLDAISRGGADAAPTRRVEWNGWCMRFSLLPKTNTRGKNSRTIGVGPTTFEFSADAKVLRSALHRKASRYGEPDAPLVLIANAHGIDEIDEVNALFGSEKVELIYRSQQLVSRRLIRAPDGLWVGAGYRATHTRVSAVVIFRGVEPWSIGRVPTTLHLNPFATRPVPRQLLSLRHELAWSGGVSRSPGIDLEALFDRGS
jgi:hypothetical protein